MSGDAPRVSVVIPTHNRADVLAECLEGVLTQEGADFETVCVNDASTDATDDVLARYTERFPDRLRVARGAFGAPGLARNAGVAAARGRLLLFTDDDCTVPSGWIAEMLELWRLRRSGVVALSGGFAPYSMETPTERYLHFRMAMLFGPRAKLIAAAPMMSFLVDRDAFEAADGFPSSPMPALEDWALCQRLRARGGALWYGPAVKVTHRYQREWGPALRRLQDTGRLGAALCANRRERAAMLVKAALKLGSAPLWTPWFFPADLYAMALRAEWVFFKARARALARPSEAVGGEAPGGGGRAGDPGDRV